MLYNDASPHENHHAASSLRLLNDPACNFLQGAEPEVRVVRAKVNEAVS